MHKPYRPCSYFDEPIITSNGVIFGLETNGQYITGQLPPHIQYCHNRSGDVPIMHSPSYSNQTRYYAPEQQKTITRVEEKKQLTHKEKYELAQQISNKTGLHPNNTSNHEDYYFVIDKINKLLIDATTKGIDSITYHVSQDSVMLSKLKKKTHESATTPATTPATTAPLVTIAGGKKYVDKSINTDESFSIDESDTENDISVEENQTIISQVVTKIVSIQLFITSIINKNRNS